MPAEAVRPVNLPARVEIFDTTLRDGSQAEGFSLTARDKLRVAEQLDRLGVHYIEGGWPGANPKDGEFFARASAGELALGTAKLVAFGSTRKAGGRAETDPVMADLLQAGTDFVCLVAKSARWHVTETLQTTTTEALDMVADSVAFLRSHGRVVFVDAEHFFDGYLEDPLFPRDFLRVVEQSGATAVLCDTNGGALPHQAQRAVGEARKVVSGHLGVHFHNDSGCAVANSLVAVCEGADHVQGCVNGYGERTGNADLTAVIPDLSLKLGVETIGRENLALLAPVAHHIAEIVNLAPNPHQPFVGASAFAHKAGIHTSAIARAPGAYSHVDPEAVGNSARVVLSEMSGRSAVALKAQEMGLRLSDGEMADIVGRLKELENRGYHFEVADGSLELLMRKATGWKQSFFHLESHRVVTDLHRDGTFMTEARIKVLVGDERILEVAEGNGPVHALDAALRKALGPRHPELSRIHLTDYKVRVLDSALGTGAVTRVLIDSTDGERTWTTIGVSENIIEASWEALSDSIVFGLLHSGATERAGGAGVPAASGGGVAGTR
ncbi:MAG TPA: citramalate synthase, partial [Acidimicrobiales bacterium]|nr:citramalate synthase [Acidimicrobiales bacterium]